jgi:hypothetical protein
MSKPVHGPQPGRELTTPISAVAAAFGQKSYPQPSPQASQPVMTSASSDSSIQRPLSAEPPRPTMASARNTAVVLPPVRPGTAQSAQGSPLMPAPPERTPADQTKPVRHDPYRSYPHPQSPLNHSASASHHASLQASPLVSGARTVVATPGAGMMLPGPMLAGVVAPPTYLQQQQLHRGSAEEWSHMGQGPLDVRSPDSHTPHGGITVRVGGRPVTTPFSNAHNAATPVTLVAPHGGASTAGRHGGASPFYFNATPSRCLSFDADATQPRHAAPSAGPRTQPRRTSDASTSRTPDSQRAPLPFIERDLEPPKDAMRTADAQRVLKQTSREAFENPAFPALANMILAKSENVRARALEIEKGKCTPEYRRYLQLVPRDCRQALNPNHPLTPRVDYNNSVREFKRLKKAWRCVLHVWGSEKMDGSFIRTGSAYHASSYLDEPTPQTAPEGVVPLREEDEETRTIVRNAFITDSNDPVAVRPSTPQDQMCPRPQVHTHRPTPVKAAGKASAQASPDKRYN